MTFATRLLLALSGATSALALSAGVLAYADEALTGDGLRTLLVGNTVQGTMQSSGTYAEFYRPDGTIKAATYTGSWSIEDDAFCTQYGADPKECWKAAKEGGEIHWLKDGRVDGTGTITPGDPNNY